MREFSHKAAAEIADSSLDFVYIDGNHQYGFVIDDLESWYPKIRAGGLIAGDDASDFDDSKRNEHGDVELVHEYNPDGTKKSWGLYGVVKAARDFTQANGLDLHFSASQFLFSKP